ncbi:hypothetical protein B296_00003307 [Ensete ventricosum]|uniref:Uncharacterized protein n=1 Tax=Ensete ventricosum TaxID=4639 RepID=A0A427ATH0_ENSVE|nr:hypothetical protein B296_00003307 [Ensete ventricosum]
MVAADEPRNSFDLVRFEGHHDPEIGGIGRAATLDAKVARKDELRRQKEAPIAFHRLEHGKRQKGRRSWRFADVLTVGDLFRRAMSHWRTNLGPLELEAALRILNTVRSVYLFIFRMLVFGAASAYG